jgi:nucleoredoxin
MKTIALGLCAAAVLTGSALAEPFASTVKGDLVALKGKRTSKFDDAPLANAKYFAVYFSASWCGPCKAFTPDLVKWYNATKPQHPEFELILVSRDHDEKSMEDYMAADQMPWPAVKFSKIARAKNIMALAGTGIPCLVFLDAEGKVLSHSYEGQNYVGPRKVMADIGKTLGAAVPADTSTPAPAADSTAASPTAATTAPPPPSTGAKLAPTSPQGSNFDQFFKKKNP